MSKNHIQISDPSDLVIKNEKSFGQTVIIDDKNQVGNASELRIIIMASFPSPE